MLLIDGVKYEEWEISNEDELEQMVIEHAQEIFGKNSIYFDRKQRLKSLAGVGSIPDGLVVAFGDVPQWHIVEVELSSHDPYAHIVPQVDKFLNAIDNRYTRNNIIEALYDAINADDLLKLKTRLAIGLDKDAHKFLSDLIVSSPTMTIVIEKDTSQLKEALKKYTQKKVVEFRTYTREDAEKVHAHLFEPLHKAPSVQSVKSQWKVQRTEEIGTSGGKEPSNRNKLYQQFFRELIDEYCKMYPTQARLSAQPQRWLGFGAGKSGLYFNWAFRNDKRFSVELYIDTVNKDKNKQYYQQIFEKRTILSSELASACSFEELEGKKASRIAIYTNGDIEDVVSNILVKEKLIKWSCDTMKKFSNALKPIIDELY